MHTRQEDRLMELFRHHNSRIFDKLASAPGEAASDRVGSQAFGVPSALSQRDPACQRPHPLIINRIIPVMAREDQLS
jgi:hypothetical protein